MNDITMCQNENCERKLECYRYMAVPDDYWQSFSQYEYICYKDENNKENNYKYFYYIGNKPTREVT